MNWAEALAPEGYYPQLKVHPIARGIMATQAVLSFYMVVTLSLFISPVTEVVFSGWVPWTFLVMWILGVVGASLAVIIGTDFVTRFAAAFGSVVYWMSVASILTDTLPFSQQFFTLALSVGGGVVMLLVASLTPHEEVCFDEGGKAKVMRGA